MVPRSELDALKKHVEDLQREHIQVSYVLLYVSLSHLLNS